MEASNKTFRENMLTGIEGLTNAVEKQSDETKELVGLMKAAFTAKK